jgi:hypothetical protein
MHIRCCRRGPGALVGPFVPKQVYGSAALPLSRWPAHDRPLMSADVPSWRVRSLLSWLLGSAALAWPAGLDSAIIAGRHEIVDTTVTPDATEYPLFVILADAILDHVGQCPSLLPCPDRAIRVGVVRRLPRVIHHCVVELTVMKAAQRDAHRQLVDAQPDAADDTPLLIPGPDRAIREGVDVVRRLLRVIHDRVVHLASAEHDARVLRRHADRC